MSPYARPRLELAKRSLAAVARPTCVARRRGRTLHLDLEGPVGSTHCGKGIYADTVLRALRSNPDATRIEVEIDSIGGNAQEAIAIYEGLVKHPARVTVTAGKECSSAGTIILMSGDRREAYPYSKLLVHGVSIEPNEALGATGGGRWTAGKFHTIAAVADATDRRLIDIYVERTRAPRAFFERELRTEEFLSLATAERMGVIHSLVEGLSAVDLAANEKLMAEWKAFRSSQ